VPVLQQPGFLHLGLDLFGGGEMLGDDRGSVGGEFLEGGVGAARGEGFHHGEDFRMSLDHGGDVGAVKGGTFQAGKLGGDGLVLRIERGGEGDLFAGGDFGERGVDLGVALDHVRAEFFDAGEGGIRLGGFAELDFQHVHGGDGGGKLRDGHLGFADAAVAGFWRIAGKGGRGKNEEGEGCDQREGFHVHRCGDDADKRGF